MNSSTQEKILDTAERLIQTRGYNAFSYKDIANAVGIKTSSIHYYYPSKEDLALAVIDWQLTHISIKLEEIKGQTTLSTREKILALVEAVLSLTYNDEMKMCLGGMFASDVLSLPESIYSKVRYFFNTLMQWIEKILSEGKQSSDINLLYPIDNLPLYLIVQLEGALLMARLYGDVKPINLVKQFINNTFV